MSMVDENELVPGLALSGIWSFIYFHFQFLLRIIKSTVTRANDDYEWVDESQ